MANPKNKANRSRHEYCVH